MLQMMDVVQVITRSFETCAQLRFQANLKIAVRGVWCAACGWNAGTNDENNVYQTSKQQ
jgi:uncharacterized protein (DUF2267 family)